MRAFSISFLLVSVLLTVAPSASASTIYDNGALITDQNLACRPACPDLLGAGGSGVFTLASNATLTGVRFWTFQFDGAYNGGTLDWNIFQDNGTQRTLIGSGTFTLSETMIGTVNVAGIDVTAYQNNFTIPSLAINPASPPQTYLLHLFDSSGRDTFGSYWATSGAGTLAFQLFGSSNAATPEAPASSPEPSTFVLIAAGAAGLLVKHRMRSTN